MKRINTCSLLLAASFLAVLVAGCQKDTVTLRARIAGGYGGGKVYMNNVTPCWNAGDLVSVNGEPCTLSVGTTATNGNIADVPASGSYKAIYPGSFQTWLSGSSVNFFIPGEQTYETDTVGRQKITAPMGACTSNPANLQFHNLGGLLEIQLYNNIKPGTIYVTRIVVFSQNAAIALWGDASVADLSDPYSYYVISDNPSRGGHDSVALIGCHIPLAYQSTTPQVAYVAVPHVGSNINNRFTIRVYVADGRGWDGYYELSQSAAASGNIHRNQIATVPYNMSQTVSPYLTVQHDVSIPVGALTSQFSVALNKKVYFSAGNLQWSATGGDEFTPDNPNTVTHSVAGGGTASGVWRFAPHQWDIVGLDNGSANLTANNRNTQGAWIDLFGWGTSGYNGSYPYMNSTENGSYISRGSGMSLTGSYLNYDWGAYNAINYGEATAPAGTYRTLTAIELIYLFSQRQINGETGLGHSFSIVTLSEGSRTHHGALIYPDGYTGTTSRTSITEADLLSIGGVFLPFAGTRNGTAVDVGTAEGRYWSSTAKSTSAIYYLRVAEVSALSTGYSTPFLAMYFGLSVRLVADVPASK